MTVDEYLDGAPSPQRETLIQLRRTLRGILPDATEKISYSIPAFEVNDKVVAGYGYFKRHCSYFPHSGSVLPPLADLLEGYDWDKGTLRFPVDEPLPRSLVESLVRERLRQLELG